jgi:hypothetical protein
MAGTLNVPEIRYDMSEADYFTHPALSCSGAKLMLQAPALYRWQMDHPEAKESTEAQEFGSAVHRFVLNAGPQVVPVDATDWKKKATQEHRKQLRAEGKIPLLKDDYWRAREMADAVWEHPIAKRIWGAGEPEVSMMWTDPDTDVQLRLRLDWLGEPINGHLVLGDLKTSRSANPRTFITDAARYRYFMQAAFYSDGVKACIPELKDVSFVFVVVEKDPPFLVSVIQLTETDMERGRRWNRRAINLFAECAATDTWPGYIDGEHVARVPLPRWIDYEEDE